VHLDINNVFSEDFSRIHSFGDLLMH